MIHPKDRYERRKIAEKKQAVRRLRNRRPTAVSEDATPEEAPNEKPSSGSDYLGE